MFSLLPWPDGEAGGTELGNTLKYGGAGVPQMDWSASCAAREGGRSKTPDGRSRPSFLQNRRDRSFNKSVRRRSSPKAAEQKNEDEDAVDCVADDRNERRKVDVSTKRESSAESTSSAALTEAVGQSKAIGGGGETLEELPQCEGAAAVKRGTVRHGKYMGNDGDRSLSIAAESHVRPTGISSGESRLGIKPTYEDEHDAGIEDAELAEVDTSSSQEDIRSTMLQTKAAHREDDGVDQIKRHTGLQCHRDDRQHSAMETDSSRERDRSGDVEGSKGVDRAGMSFEVGLGDGRRARRYSGPRGLQAASEGDGNASGQDRLGKEVWKRLMRIVSENKRPALVFWSVLCGRHECACGAWFDRDSDKKHLA